MKTLKKLVLLAIIGAIPFLQTGCGRGGGGGHLRFVPVHFIHWR
jgi:hypothetical protein